MLAGCGEVGDFVGDPIKGIKSGGTLQFTSPSETQLIVTWNVLDQLNAGPTFYAYFNGILEDTNAVSPDTLSVPIPLALPTTTIITIAPGISHAGYNPFPYPIANITTRLPDISVPSDVFASDLAIVFPQYHTIDMFTKEGGTHTSRQISSDVDSVFLPGIIVGSDSSETVRYQHRKVFVKNIGNDKPYYVKLYGYNTKHNGVVKFALEKGLDQNPKIDGSEVIANYLTPPSLFGTYTFTELNSDHAIEVGNHGILSEGNAQGVWLRQACAKNISDMASDLFILGIFWSELG